MSASEPTTRAPRGLKTGGKRLWNRVMKDYELAEHEESLLLQACRMTDTLDRLQKTIDEGAIVINSPQGIKTNPAVVEFRQTALALAKCVASLRIPDDADGDQPQRRGGARASTA